MNEGARDSREGLHAAAFVRSDESAERLRLSVAAAAELASALTAGEVSEILLGFCEQSLGAVAGVVYLTRDDETKLYFQGERGVPSARKIEVLTPNLPLPLAHAIRDREPVWLETYEALVERFPNVAGASIGKERLQAIVAMPMLHLGRLVGGFALSFDRPRTFEASDRRWLSDFGKQCALAAERARLYEAEKRARSEAETLYRIAESLNLAQLDLEALVQRVTDEARALVGANFGAFFYNAVDAQGESSLFYSVSGAPKEAFAKFGLPRNTPLFAPTFAGEAVVRLADVTRDPRYGKMAPHYGMPAGHLPVVSYMAVPVVSRTGAVLGGLFFAHREPDRFSAQHERLVKVLASNAAAAIDNARLFHETREAEKNQRRLVGELTETVRLNDLFAGVLAHDLRNPLGAILTSAGLAAEYVSLGAPPARLDKPLARIAASGNRMSRMIDQLLDLTRIRIGAGIRIDPKELDLLSITRRVLEELEGANPNVAFRISRTGETSGRWDEDRLEQVLSNLLGNAVQHGEAERGVRIVLNGLDPARVRIEVHNGGFIPEEVRAALFSPLSEKQRRRGKAAGLGLGLFISQEIARAHGGVVELESSEAAGTTFSLTLPRYAEARAVVAPSSEIAGFSPDSDAGDERWQRSAALAETGRKFRLLVESVKDYAIFMLDTDGRVATWNSGAERIKGYSAREIIGQHFSKFYEPAEAATGICERKLEIARTEGRFEAEGFRVRKDGTKFWANVVITALFDPEGELIGFAKVTRDLTERRRLEEERVRRAQAEEAVRLRDEFLALASHELKTPLAILQLQLDALEEHASSLDPALQKTVERARRGTERLSRLVDALLEVTRLATNTFALSLERFDLAEAVLEGLDDIRAAAAQARCELVADIERPLVGTWDRRRIQRVLGSLLWNALVYAEGTPIRVSLKRVGAEAVLEVVDEGPGIPPPELERIFGRFERSSSTRDVAGLGLGLYLVKEIATAHGGTATAESASGEGARFVVRLPIEPKVETREDPEAS